MKRELRNILLWGCTFVVVAALVVWVYVRWDVWFYNVPEREYVAERTPGRVLLTFGCDGEWSRNVSWQCGDSVGSGSVELVRCGTTDTMLVAAEGEVFVSRGGKACYYVARLRGLEEGSTYSYRIKNDTLYSDWYTFHTQTKRGPIDFVYIGDVQDTMGTAKNRAFKEMLRRHNETDFIVFGGDWAERPCDNYWQEAFNGVDSIGQNLPILCTAGNHEYLKGLIMHLERRFRLVFSYFLDSSVEDNCIYSLRYGNAKFYFLDSNRELPYLITQRRWLKKELAASDAKWNILVLHHPLYSIRGRWTNLIQRGMFGDLAKQCDLVLQGHEHNYARSSEEEQPIYVVSHWSPKHYRLYRNPHYEVFEENMPTYQCIHISEDTLVLTSYKADTHEANDRVEVVKRITAPH